MRLITYEQEGKEIVGLLHVDGKRIAPLDSFGLSYACMNELICRITQEERQRLDELQNIPDFDSTVRIPRDVPSGDGDGNDESTRDDFKLARIDAWVLTHDIFTDLKKGEITRAEAIKEIEELAKAAAKDEDLFSAARFEYYDSLGDAADLARLLSGAVSNLQESARQ